MDSPVSFNPHPHAGGDSFSIESAAVTPELAGAPDPELAAQQAAELEDNAQAAGPFSTYTHTLSCPITVQNKTVEELSFDFSTLTGKDFLEIEDTFLRNGKNLVVPAFTGPFLCAMAARACTLRDPVGVPLLRTADLRALPLRDFMDIAQHARDFLLLAGL